MLASYQMSDNLKLRLYKNKERVDMSRGRSFKGDGLWNRGRDSLESDNYLPRRSRRRAKQMGLDPGPTFFVPSYSVRRPVVVTDQLKGFIVDLNSNLPRNYRVKTAREMALTILEQRLLISKFRAIDFAPEADEVKAVAKTTKEQLAFSLTDSKAAVPRKLPFALGRISSFGTTGSPTKIGIEPLGWKGFNTSYSDRSAEGLKGSVRERQAIPILIREADLCVGAMANGFNQYDDLPEFNSINPYNRTPHITIAQKQRGGSISQSELSGIAGIVLECLPESGEFELFDPIIFTQFGPKSSDRETLLVRPCRVNNVSVVPVLSDLA